VIPQMIAAHLRKGVIAPTFEQEHALTRLGQGRCDHTTARPCTNNNDIVFVHRGVWPPTQLLTVTIARIF
jgi:hypothetical protein